VGVPAVEPAAGPDAGDGLTQRRGEERPVVGVGHVVVEDGELVGRPALNAGVVRRVGQQQVCGVVAQHPAHVRGLRGVAAQQPVAAEFPQVARLRDGLGRWLGHLVGVAVAGGRRRRTR